MIGRRAILGLLGGIPLMSFGQKSAQGFGNTDVLIAEQVILEGNQRFLLAYSPTGGFNNLSYSISPVTGNTPDQYGNLVLGGAASYGFDSVNNRYVAIQNIVDNVNFFDAATMAGPWSLQGQISFYNNDVPGNITFNPLGAGNVVSLGNFLISQGKILGQIYSNLGTVNVPVAATWQLPALTGFTTPAGNNAVEFILAPDSGGNVDVQGLMQASAAYAANTTVFTVPAIYRPVATATISAQVDNVGAFTGCWAAISNTGAVSLPVAIANGNIVSLNGRYRLAI